MIPPIYIIAQNNVSASSIAGPIDVFHTANLLIKNIIGESGEQLIWKIVSLRETEIASATGITFKSESLLNQITEPGWIYIPGVVVENDDEVLTYLNCNQDLANKLSDLYNSGFSLAANCTGVFLLADSGVLDGKSATTTWWLKDLFHKRYPRVELDIDSLIINHRRIICTGTAMAHLEMALSLVDKILGGKYAHLCRKYLLIENSHKTQTPYLRLTNNQKSTFMQSANQYLLSHLHEDLRMHDIASALAVSIRTLNRRIKESTGDTPLQHIQKLRIERSKYLLETSSLSTGEIIERVGYYDNSSFGVIFKRYTGLTLGQYRQKFCAQANLKK